MTVLLEDRHAAHQIVLSSATEPHRITVWCTCQRRHRPFPAPIEARRRFPAPEAVAAWAAWHREQVPA